MFSKQIFLASITKHAIHFVVLRKEKQQLSIEHASQLPLSLDEEKDFFSLDEVGKKAIHKHIASFSHPKKLHLILPHEYFRFLFVPQGGRKKGKKHLRKMLVQSLGKEGKESLLKYGFEYDILPNTKESVIAFRLLPKSLFERIEGHFQSLGLHIESFHSDIAQYEWFLRKEFVLPFFHFHFGEEKSFLNYHLSSIPYIREQKFSFSQESLFQVYRAHSLPEEEYNRILSEKGLFFGEEFEQFHRPIEKILNPLTQFLLDRAVKGNMYVTSYELLPKYLLYFLERHTGAEVKSVCIFDLLKKKDEVDGILHIHREKDKIFAPLLVRAIFLVK